MKPSTSLLILALASVGWPAFAQTLSNGGTPTSNAAAMLKIVASNPVLHPDPGRRMSGFRMLIRATSNTGADVLYVADNQQYIKYLQGDGLTGWQAYTGGGVLCMVRSQNGATGLDSINMRYAHTYQAGAWSAGPVRPALITADFICDGPVVKGDELTLQIKLFLMDRGTWKAADYVFERLKIQ